MSAQQTRVAFSHLPRYAIDGLVNRRIHIIVLGTGFDCDVVCAIQNDLSNMTVFLHIQDYLSLNNLWIVKMESCNLASNVLSQGFCDVDMPGG
jgi:hypothetical protein